MLHALMGLLRRLAEALLALVILFEEWGWEPLQRALARLGRLPLLRHLEALAARAPPRVAVLLFLVPAALLLPVKLAALGLITSGRPALGLAVVLLAKLLGTALVARLYALTQPALMQLPWFVQWHGRWMSWKTIVLDRMRATRVWRQSRAIKRRLRQRWEHWRTPPG